MDSEFPGEEIANPYFCLPKPPWNWEQIGLLGKAHAHTQVLSLDPLSSHCRWDYLESTNREVIDKKYLHVTTDDMTV